MSFYIYSGVIPIAIIAVILWFHKPLDFQNIVKGFTKSLHPLITYMLLVYFLETENHIDSGWAFVTISMFYIPYLAIVLILNLVAWNKRRKA